MTRKVPLLTGGESRYHDDDRGKHMQLDEVCTEGLHLERMDTNAVHLVIGTGDNLAHISIYTDAPHRLRMFVIEGELPA